MTNSPLPLPNTDEESTLPLPLSDQLPTALLSHSNPLDSPKKPVSAPDSWESITQSEEPLTRWVCCSSGDIGPQYPQQPYHVDFGSYDESAEFAPNVPILDDAHADDLAAVGEKEDMYLYFDDDYAASRQIAKLL
ncbi:hypothetical protein HDU86_000352 [Geranomyces michiganensis]|nr:hypothetical protein HDU86_000352 [Geranomyces michiganensis]